MKALIDVNVVLDVLRDRGTHAAASAAVWAAIETGQAEGLLAAHAVTTIHYLIRREQSTPKARRTILKILSVFGIASVDEGVIQEALQSPSPDFEDAVTIAAARLAGCDAIITRDPRGFRQSPVLVFTPEAALPLLAVRSST
ncbi:MAG: PIN domain-containing protein [Acidobacteriota bacterium]|nr:PIN domain-containing protein [Acidobacteriota bacterium]